jgi:predicted transcriptional regulator
MTANNSGSDAVVEECVEVLQSFELTEYESKCFVALSRIGHGTAKEVSEVADIPQARVYDSMETLQERGLVDIQQSKPRKFRAAVPSDAIDALERRYSERLDRLGELFARLESPARDTSEGNVWVMEGSSEVSERIRELIDGAESEVLLAIASADLLTDELVAAIDAADDRGVEVLVGSPGEEIRERITGTGATAEVVETWTWWESYPIRPGAMSAVCMVDRDAMLVSADAASSLPGVRKHRAVWTDSSNTPLVKMMRPLLTTAITRDQASA